MKNKIKFWDVLDTVDTADISVKDLVLTDFMDNIYMLY